MARSQKFPESYNIAERFRKVWLAQCSDDAWEAMLKREPGSIATWGGSALHGAAHAKRVRDEVKAGDIAFLYSARKLRSVIGIARIAAPPRIAKKATKRGAALTMHFDWWAATPQVSWQALRTDAVLKHSEKVALRSGSLFRLSLSEARRLLALMKKKPSDFPEILEALTASPILAPPSRDSESSAPRSESKAQPSAESPTPTAADVQVATQANPRALPPSTPQDFASRHALTPEEAARMDRHARALAATKYREDAYEIHELTSEGPLWFSKGGLKVRVLVRGSEDVDSPLQFSAEEIEDCLAVRARTDLFVVGKFHTSETPSGDPQSDQVRQLIGWMPVADRLRPTAFAYTIDGSTAKQPRALATVLTTAWVPFEF